MKKIGLTGGIGSGKSVVAKIFEDEGFPVYFADTEAKKICDTNVQVREKLTARFGEDLYKNGVLDRKLLASLIFGEKESHKENSDFVGSVVHPFVFEDFKAWVDKQRSGPMWRVPHRPLQLPQTSGLLVGADMYSYRPAVVVESAILFESGLDKYVDFVVNISAPESVRIQRVMERDGLSQEEILSRMCSQLSDDEREARADYTIINDGCLAVMPRVKELIAKLS